VDRNSAAFERVLHALDVQADGFIRTSSDPTHAEGVAAIWRACATRGDLYRQRYRGLYCVGCEQFFTPDELVDGRCPEHGTPPEPIEEENWFFRLSRYQDEIRGLLESGRLRVVPETRRREALAFVTGGLRDLSVSRARARARGWGIPVPGDPSQVVYVWFDALANYVTALGYPRHTATYRTFWERATTTHVIGKGILRFHAVYWPAILLSAGLPPPDRLLVHGYLQSNGARFSKSSGVHVDPIAAAERVGTEALRYWLLRAVGRGEDADWTEERALDLRRAELSNELGNLLQRTVGLVQRSGGVVQPAPSDGELSRSAAGLFDRLSTSVGDGLDPQAALAATWEVVRAANRYANLRQPWRLDGAARDGAVLSLAESLRVVSEALRPFLPRTADGIASQLGITPASAGWAEALRWDGRTAGATVGEPRPLFPRIG
jgi:methionyl-tRNA synthetase